jgi:hypothetical protein
MIRLETSKRTGIDNFQLGEVSVYERNWTKEISKRFPNVTQRTDMSSVYNCHGLTFASRRTRIIDPRGIQHILDDDKWIELEMEKALPGDIVIYYSDEGEPNHSGIVLEINSLGVPIICSKWGSAGEYTHLLTDIWSCYGPQKKFYRCRL